LLADDEETERGNFKEILGQIDEYIQSLQVRDNATKSDSENELEQATA